MSNKPRWPWILLALFAAFLLLIPGLWVFMGLTAVPVHVDPRAIPSLSAAPPPQSLATAVEESRAFLRGSLKEHNVAALSVAIAKRDEIVWAEAFGVADIDRAAPAAPTHRLRIGTASIPLTATAIGILLDEGKIKLDADIATHVPDFPKKAQPITIRHLLSHLSGLRNDGGDESELYGAQCKSPFDALPFFANQELLHAPNTKFHFSNYAYILLAAAIESASRTPFHQFLQHRILDPLGMRDTAFELTPSEVHAPSYFPRFAADPTYGLDPMRALNFSCYLGASGLLSTAADLARFLVAVNGDRLLSPETRKALQEPQRLPGDRETGYALGWDLDAIALNGQSFNTVGHEGMILGGPAAALLSVPAKSLHVVVLTNTSYAPALNMAATVAQAFSR